MKTGNRFAGIYCLLLVSIVSLQAQSTFTQPVIYADVPDMAMIRVGPTYYMSSTTMHMSPGLPIMKSNDLVNWKLTGYAYDSLVDNDAMNLTNGQNAYGEGSWASSLRYHNGTFYATTFSATSGNTHVYTTEDIENGPWKATAFEPVLHDHTLFFDDDGRVYMIYGSGEIRLVELNADASGIKPGGINEVIIPDASRIAGGMTGLPAEGSQMIKVNGEYYLFHITWPQNDMRTQIVHRAKSIHGPYESKVVLKDKGIAQGSIIDTPEGEWYAYLFQDCGAVGRVPFLIPVKWVDGWPVLGENGKVPDSSLPAIPAGLSGIISSDEFTRAPGDPLLPLAWQWNHNPDNEHWSLVERPGYLRLTTGHIATEVVHARNTLTQRTYGPESTATTSMDITRMKEGDWAGLIALQKKYGFVGVKIENGIQSLVMVSTESGKPVEQESLPVNQTVVYLKIVCDFKDRTDKAYFYYSLDGETWKTIGHPLKMEYTLPHFMGYRFGLFNFATQTPGGLVDFDYFRISGK